MVVLLSRNFYRYIRQNIDMEISERNRKVASSRWEKVYNEQVANITHNKKFIARLCGFLAGDGSVRVRKEANGRIHHTLEFFPDDQSLINPYMEALVGVYHKKPSIEISSNHFRLRLNSKVIVNDLLKIAKFGLKRWQVPEGILKNRSTRKEWLRAYFDSEAYVGRKYIRVQSVNKRGLKGVKNLLDECHIASRFHEYRPKRKKWSTVYILTISKKVDRIKFLRVVGFNHAKKLKKLLSYLDNAEVA